MAIFGSLAAKLQETFAKLRNKGKLTEDDINTAMREIRLSLLEADVNFKVVKSFTTINVSSYKIIFCVFSLYEPYKK